MRCLTLEIEGRLEIEIAATKEQERAESLFSPACVSVRRRGELDSTCGSSQCWPSSVLQCPEHTCAVFHVSPACGCDSCAGALCRASAAVVQSCASAGRCAPWHPASTLNQCTVLSPALPTCLRPAGTAQLASVRFHLELPQNRICLCSACLQCSLSHADPWKWQMLPGKVIAGTVSS